MPSGVPARLSGDTPRADLARRPPLSGDCSGAPPDLVGPDLERPWPGSCACSTPTPWASSAEPWTPEPSAGPSQQKARTTISTAPTAATATCVPSSPSPWATLAAMALRRAAESAPTPRSHRAEVEFAWARSGGGALVRRRRDRNDAPRAELHLARRPIRPELAPTSRRARPREPRPSRALEPPRRHPPVGPPTAKGGCLVPCPESERCSWRPSSRASWMSVGVAHADNLQVDDLTVVGDFTVNVDENAEVSYQIRANSGDGGTQVKDCNAADTTPATVTIHASDDVTVSPNPLIFTACKSSQTVNFSSSVAGDYEITASVADSGAAATTPTRQRSRCTSSRRSTPHRRSSPPRTSPRRRPDQPRRSTSTRPRSTQATTPPCR